MRTSESDHYVRELRLTRLSRKYLLLTAIALATVAGAAAGAWALIFRPIQVQVSHVERDVPVQVFGLGTVEARIQSKVGFKVSGVLVDLRADVGDCLPKGTVLARLDDREQSARARKAAAAVEQAEANLQRATASVGKAQANYANARSINERRQRLVQSNIASIETAESAQAAEDAARADVSLANSEVLVAKAAISDAKALQQQEAATLDFHTLTAPYDAMVVTRQKELGSALAAGEPVFTLIDPQSVWVLAYIDESKAGEIRVGESVAIVLRSLPGERFDGRVARIQRESDRVNEERRIEVTFDHIPDDFHLGEQAEVYITTIRLGQALLVPEAAIDGLAKNRGTVWTVEDGHLERREAVLGHRLLDGRYEIIGGIPNDAVVVNELRSGLRVGRAAEITDGRAL
jgi:HlyD family secretion protein